MKTALIAAAAALLAAGCTGSRDTAAVPMTTPSPVPGLQPAEFSQPVGMVLKARIYKTNGDYTDNVPVTVGADGKIVSYPAPGDVAGAEPVKLDDGYLLDRRGISRDTRFTRYTYSQYAALSQAPTMAELLESIIPDARVTEIVEMPFAYGTDITARCNREIKSSLKDCRKL